MTLSLYDGIMLAIVFFCVIHGAIKGMAWQLAPIASLVLGYLFGVPLSSATAPWFGNPPLNRVFALITMYMLVSLGVYLIARSLRESIERTKLVEFDRHLGALLGGIKGVLFTTVLTVALVAVSPSAASLVVHSESKTIAENIISYVGPLLPKDVHDVIDPYLKPIEALPDDEPHSLVKGRGSSDTGDVARNSREPFKPRPRRSVPIFEDDTLDRGDEEPFDVRDSTSSRSSRSRPRDTFDEPAEFDEPAPRRRRRTSSETESKEFDSANRDPFGQEPEPFEEEETPIRRR